MADPAGILSAHRWVDNEGRLPHPSTGVATGGRRACQAGQGRERPDHYTAGIRGSDGKPVSGADISFPVVLAMLGQQFAGTEADLSMNMNVSASTLDETHGKQEGSASGEGKFGIAGLSVSVKVSASFSEAEDHKRESDYRATTSANLKMARVPTPEPIQGRVLQAFMSVVDVECDIAKATIQQNAQAVAVQKRAPTPSGGLPLFAPTK